jgi:pSer/pThr/pTyr-binding forkhead associated (FHA) protein
VICDCCGRDNPKNLIFCQDCGRRLQEPPPAVVAPTPPSGLPKAAAQLQGSRPSPYASRAEAPAFGFSGPVLSPAAIPSERAAPGAVVCPRCQTRNPLSGRFCVSCGAVLGEAGVQQPAPVQQRPMELQQAAMTPQQPPIVAPTQPDLAPDQQPVRPVAMVSIASERAKTAATTTCERCQGVCEAGMRFCKFCGAPLPQPDSANKLGNTMPQADPGKPARGPEYAKTPARPGIQAAIEEAARQASAFSPRPRIEAGAIAAPARPSARPALDQGQRGAGGQPPTEPATPQALEAARQGGLVADKPSVATGTYGAGFAGPAEEVAGRLIVIAGDGQEGPSFPLVGDQVDVGRTDGTVVLPDDKYMSPRHARLMRIQGQWWVRDLGSTNGVYARIAKPHELADSDLLLLGVEVLRFETMSGSEAGFGPAVQHGTFVFGSPALPRHARLVQRSVEGVARDVYHLHRLETIIGRESGDLVFTDDPYMSRRHALIRRDSVTGKYTLVDLDSSNGTFVAIRGDRELQNGDSIRVGQHLFRVDLLAGQR